MFYHNFSKKNFSVFSIQGQSPFYEGDIVLDRELWKKMQLLQFENLFRGSKKSLALDRRDIVKSHRLWPNAIVPYHIDENLGEMKIINY